MSMQEEKWFVCETDRGLPDIEFWDVKDRDKAVSILNAHEGKGFSDEILIEEILRRLKGYENKNWLFTHSGIQVFLANPSIEQINIDDIAHAICHLCRYNGQCNKFFSVGEHSVLVAQDILRKTGDKALALAGLMHDSPEAYLCDVTGPLKDMLLVYGILEARFERVIREKYNIVHPFDHPQIKKSDYEVFFTEADHLFDFSYIAWGRKGDRADVKIEGQRPERARERFLQMAHELGLAA